ncbi:MAG TPA: DUF2243 domain-containing protein [Streptosporangiaceae bacterium]
MAAAPIDRPGGSPAAERKRTVWSGLLAGIGLAAFIDETVFHQLLHWHHFYDKSTSSAGLVSDGIFHAFGFTALVVGAFLMADALRRGGFIPKRWWAALLLGAGGFQLYDGTVQHKLLGLHQIRYGVTLWPYDLAWDGIAVIALIAGTVLIRGRAGPATSGIFRTGAPPAG